VVNSCLNYRKAISIPFAKAASIRFENGLAGRAIWVHSDDGRVSGFTVGSIPFLLVDQLLPFLASRLLHKSDRTQEWQKVA